MGLKLLVLHLLLCSLPEYPSPFCLVQPTWSHPSLFLISSCHALLGLHLDFLLICLPDTFIMWPLSSSILFTWSDHLSCPSSVTSPIIFVFNLDLKVLFLNPAHSHFTFVLLKYLISSGSYLPKILNHKLRLSKLFLQILNFEFFWNLCLSYCKKMEVWGFKITYSLDSERI